MGQIHSSTVKYNFSLFNMLSPYLLEYQKPHFQLHVCMLAKRYIFALNTKCFPFSWEIGKIKDVLKCLNAQKHQNQTKFIFATSSLKLKLDTNFSPSECPSGFSTVRLRKQVISEGWDHSSTQSVFPWLVFDCMLPRNSLQTSIQLQISNRKHRWSWSRQGKNKTPTISLHSVLGNLCNNLLWCFCTWAADTGTGEQQEENTWINGHSLIFLGVWSLTEV